MSDAAASQPQNETAENTPPPQSAHDAQPAPSEHDEPQNDGGVTAPGRDLMPSGSLDERIRYANALAQAGDLIPAGLRDGRTANPGKVLLAVETGAMLGLHPVAAINGVNIIDGKATLSPALMSGVVRRAGHKLRVRVDGTLEGGDLTATATLIRADDPDEPFRATWTPARAARAGLCTYAQGQAGTWSVRARSNSGKVLPWEAYTEAMLKARAIGEVCREGAEDALMGVHYTPEELGANVDADGRVVDLGTVDVVVDQSKAREPEHTPEEVAAQALERAAKAETVEQLVGVWNALPNVVVRYSWASQYADLGDYGRRTIVAHPDPASVERISLVDAFGWHRARIEGGGQGATEQTPAPDDAPTSDPAPAEDDVVDAVVEPDADAAAATMVREDVHDAEVVEDHDPWADGSAMSGPATPAQRLVAEQLGGTVVDPGEPMTPRQRAAAEHAAQLDGRRARPTPADEAPQDALGGHTPASGRDAVKAARAALEQRNEARRAAEVAGTTKGRNA